MREEYRVYYENYEELAQEEPGAEIPLQKDIVWENKNSQSERWKALSVFACPQGLVLELAKQVAPKQYLAFYEKWTFWKSWNGNRIRRQKPAGSIMV